MSDFNVVTGLSTAKVNVGTEPILTLSENSWYCK